MNELIIYRMTNWQTDRDEVEIIRHTKLWNNLSSGRLGWVEAEAEPEGRSQHHFQRELFCNLIGQPAPDPAPVEMRMETGGQVPFNS